MHLQLDHVTIAGSDLSTLQQQFAQLGLATEYGGLHSNGITHMALLGFDDGSYLELISTATPGEASPWWHRQIADNGGPCAWCAQARDLRRECDRLFELGVPVRGPVSFHRDRPDGTRIEWDLAFPGAQEPGAVLPFLIQDRTPRTLRVQPSPSVHTTELLGVAMVVIAVADLPWNAQMFQEIYGLTTRETLPEPEIDGTVVWFTGTPVALAAPAPGVSESWIAGRLAKFGDSPAAFLLRSGDLAASTRRFPSARRGSWMNRPALWFDPDHLGGIRLGII